MKCDPQQDHAITTGSFLDDSHSFCCCDTPGAAVSGICQSWRRSLEFDVITGLVTNGKKSFFFVCKSFQYCGPNPDPHGRIFPRRQPEVQKFICPCWICCYQPGFTGSFPPKLENCSCNRKTAQNTFCPSAFFSPSLKKLLLPFSCSYFWM